jgi:peptidoglycan hydrolase-like protein with peptidoglycan-binding domain
MKRPGPSVWVIGSTVLAAAAVTAAAIGFGGGGPNEPANAAAKTPATTPVTRTNLARTTQVQGVLGYGTPVVVNATGDGTITWLPAAGATVTRGQPVYKADNVARALFYGTLPLYRPLRTGDTGEDVREVEQNLAALGYGGFTIDATYTATTASAVKQWQKDLGLSQSGVVEPTTVVIAPGQLRVTVLSAHLGDPVGGPVLSYADTTRVVTVALDVGLQNLVAAGRPATVTLPDSTTIEGTVAAVGTVATAGEEHQPATIAVTVTLSDQSRLGTLDEAPVSVSLVSATAANVLTVPVAALVALAEGGYGVQVVTGSTSEYVAVQLGMFASGRVAITGDGITEGTLVGIPS